MSETVKLVVTVLCSLCGSGGLVMWAIERFTKSRDRHMDEIKEGIRLGLENDSVIFKALRENKINGESEAQEKKMNNYFRKAFMK
jgi:hypothetical protein